MKTGDLIATIAQPIAKGLDAVLGTDVQGCSSCKKMQANLNSGMSLTDAIIERLKKKELMQFIITKQILVEATTPEEAATKEGPTVSLNVQPKPQSQVPQIMPMPVARPANPR